jgi:uncharacterized protein (DUF885 family)
MKNLFFLAVIFLASSCTKPSFTPEQIAQESKRINEFFEEAFQKTVDRYPTWQTYLGLKTNYGKLDNETIEYAKEQLKIDKENLKKLKTFNYDALDEQSKISYQVFEYNMKRSIESFDWLYYGYPFNQMFGYQSRTPSFLINMHRISSVEDAEAYISRLAEIKRVFEERMVINKEQLKQGIIPPFFVFDKVIEDSKNIITGKPFDQSQDESPLLQDFRNKIFKLDISEEKRDELLKNVKLELVRSVKPAYLDLIQYVLVLAKKHKDNNGVWALPKGKKYYEYKLRTQTTTDMTADEIHEFGLKEMKRIHNEMRSIMKKVRFEGELKDFFEHMRTNKKFVFPDTEDGRKEYLAETERVIDEMKQALPKMFNTLPKADLTVKPVESYREKTAGIAFYQGPSLYGDRPGIYYVNLYKMADNPKYKLEALAYHEALPGHHMQIAIQRELEGLPKFRRTGGVTAYSEGWGLYAELVPKEFGYYKNPYSDFGRLSMELWRAARLVVDTGIHAKKWSREESIKYLKENTPNADLEIQKGVERYFVMPGQATTYKIGMQKILELRKMAREELGEKFDLRGFHDVILRNGPLPLDILENQVEAWIEKLNSSEG